MIIEWIQRQKARNILKGKKIRETTFVVCDLETTGLDIKKDRILSIGLTRIKGLRLSPDDCWWTHIEDVEYAGSGANIHQITSEELLAGWPLEESLREIREWMAESVFVGHHAMLDHGILQREFKRSGIPPLEPIFVDTIHLAQRIERKDTIPRHGQYSLESLCDRWSIPHPSVHDALSDAWVTGGLFVRMVKHLERRGVNRTSQLFH